VGNGNVAQTRKAHRLAGSAKHADIHKRILAVLIRLGRPVSAYTILEVLGDGAGRRVYPQSVYRALNTLIGRGLVHKLDSVNAFQACAHPHQPHDGIHLICDDCGSAEEIVDQRVTAMLNKDAESLHFEKRRQAIELHGICGSCRAS
jgi:Fur family zinc uptake transcriptional regulator